MQSTVLIAILNWGLGHATRSMPIIDGFLSEGYKIHIASDGDALLFLQKEYPDLDFHTLPAYKISYTYKSIFYNVIRSSFPILSAVYKERSVVHSLVKRIKPDLILSDNRYGVRHASVKSILITHQVNIKLNNYFLSSIGTYFIRYLINKFDKVWIPDNNNILSLAGDLSKVSNDNKFVYIGHLSRFLPKKLNVIYDIAIVLSGPEPQRTNFERIVLAQLKECNKKVIVVRGKVNEDIDYFLKENIEVKSYLLSDELNNVINQSEIIISRSGYSTIMDLAILGKKAILVPTPGQTEQEYLAEYLEEKKVYYFCSQKSFDLKVALEECDSYTGRKSSVHNIEKIISKV